MSCEKILDKVFEYDCGNSQDTMPLLTRLNVNFHLLICPDCAQAVERFEVCRDIHRDFVSPAPVLEEVATIMAGEESAIQAAKNAELRRSFSIRGWIIAGLVMLVSLATAFFGLDFNKVAVEMGMSFMLPIGITIGIVLTCYGALFIGSHLKELKALTERFGLYK